MGESKAESSEWPRSNFGRSQKLTHFETIKSLLVTTLSLRSGYSTIKSSHYLLASIVSIKLLQDVTSHA